MNLKRLDKEVLELIAFLASSARGVLDEPYTYGSFRLIDAIPRVYSVLKDYLSNDIKAFLDDLIDFIDKNKYKVMTDLEGYKQFLEELINTLVRKMRECYGL